MEQRLIGLKWFVEFGFSHLGMRAIKVWLICFNIFPEWKKPFTTLITDGPTMSEYCLDVRLVYVYITNIYNEYFFTFTRLTTLFMKRLVKW